MNRFSHIYLDEEKFTSQTLDYILNNQNTCLGSSLFLRILDPRIQYGDLNNHIKFLKERLSHLEFSVVHNTVEFKNKMKGYQILTTDELGRTVDNSGILGPLIFEKESFSKEVFWSNEKEEQAYRFISDFNCFKEKVVPQAKLYAALIKSDIFNIDDWIQYYQDLLDLKFPEFCDKLVQGKKIIKYKAFKDGYYLGVETDYQFCKSNFKNGNWLDPDYRLIIFKLLDKKKIDRVVSFNQFFHPHFAPPTYSFEGYFAMGNLIQVSENEFSCKYVIERKYLDNDMVRLSMSEEFGEQLKRHAYFYYDMLSHTTKEYIKFIEESFNPGDE
jgi:hypothetical protein